MVNNNTKTEAHLPYGKRSYYPHMMPADVALWERFMQQFPDVYDTVQYDVIVGNVPEFVVHDPHAGRDQLSTLYKRKIDVVGHKDGQIDIIEIGPNAGTNKVGQVLGYKHLYDRDHEPTVPTKAIVLTDKFDPDVAEFAASFNALVVVV